MSRAIEHPNLSRRSFLGGTAGTLLATSAMGEDKKLEERFRFALLGDIHYDRLEHHDMEWLKREKPNDIRQVENYSRITREVLPKLMAEVREQMAADPDSAFVAHIGDFVEGLAGTPALAERHCRDAVAFIEESKLGKPFIFCKGNHDVTGPGSVEAFNSVLMPFITREAKTEITAAQGTNFVTRQGNALFVWYDAYHGGSLDWLEKVLKTRSETHLFLMIHPPAAPYSARSNWHLFAKPTENEQRERLLKLLGRHRAIVLCGHLHKYGTIARKTTEGTFVQAATLSVVSSPDRAPRDEVQGTKEYGPDIVRLEASFSPQTKEERQALLSAEAPHIRYFDYADIAGYSMVTVAGKSVTLDIYSGLGKRRVRTINLTDLLV